MKQSREEARQRSVLPHPKDRHASARPVRMGATKAELEKASAALQEKLQEVEQERDTSVERMRETEVKVSGLEENLKKLMKEQDQLAIAKVCAGGDGRVYT